MDENKKKFSSSAEGYDKEEVDTYFRGVQEQFQKISEENKKLYTDCVSFAKRLKKIQDSGILSEDVPELKRQNEQYRQEIAELKNQIYDLSAKVPAEEPQPETEKAESPIESKKLDSLDFQDVPAAKPAPRKKPKKSHSVLRGFIIFFLVIFLLVGIISIVSSAIGHSKNPNSSFFGVRAYTITNNNMESIASNNDVVFVTRKDFNEMKTGYVILATPHDRSLAKVEAVKKDKGETVLRVSGDDNKTYSVKQDEYLGYAKYRVEGFGSFVNWVARNIITYYLILAIIIALFILLLAIIPGKKKEKAPNKKKKAAHSA